MVTFPKILRQGGKTQVWTMKRTQYCHSVLELHPFSDKNSKMHWQSRFMAPEKCYHTIIKGKNEQKVAKEKQVKAGMLHVQKLWPKSKCSHWSKGRPLDNSFPLTSTATEEAGPTAANHNTALITYLHMKSASEHMSHFKAHYLGRKTKDKNKYRKGRSWQLFLSKSIKSFPAIKSPDSTPSIGFARTRL